MADTHFGDIMMGGKPYRIDFNTWRGKDIIDFSPRATVPGGAFVMADLGILQPIVQSDWRHGFGFHWYSDAMGYLQTIGQIDTRHDGLVMLYTSATSSDTDNNVKEGMTVFNDALYTWGDYGLRKFNGTSWSGIYTAAAVNFAMAAGDYLFFCPNGLRIRKLDAADSHTAAGLDTNATDYKWMVIHNGFVYAGKDGSNAIHYDNSETLATLQGNASDTNRLLVGLGNSSTLGAEVYNGNLYIRKRDGIWHLGEDRIARRVLDFSAEASNVNLRSVAVINGFYVFALRDRILQWNGARVSDITPKKITDTFPYTTYGRFDNFVAVGDFLYLTGRTNENPFTVALLCWDGVGWHKLSDLITNGTDSITMMAYESVNNRLWYHIDATADATYYIPFQNLSTFPKAEFPVTGQHSLVTSRLDMGFRRVQKSTNSLIVEARNVNSARYISVYYALDGGSWTLWGHIKENGMIELLNPGGVPTREFYYAQLRFDFITNAATQSPILEGWTMKFIMRPVTKMGYNFRVVVATNTEHGQVDDYRTSNELLEELQALRNSISPIELVDIQGKKHTGYVTAIQEMPLDRDEDAGGDVPDIEYSYSVNFIEI